MFNNGKRIKTLQERVTALEKRMDIRHEDLYREIEYLKNLVGQLVTALDYRIDYHPARTTLRKVGKPKQ